MMISIPVGYCREEDFRVPPIDNYQKYLFWRQQRWMIKDGLIEIQEHPNRYRFNEWSKNDWKKMLELYMMICGNCGDYGYL